jgi:serine/threonine protein kinase
VLPRFDILGELGRGGMGVVYKGRDRETGEAVALKVLRSDLGESPAILERFRNEVRLARRITHKNVCRVHDFHRDGDVAYISMEFVQGESLRALLDQKTLDQKKQFTQEEGLAIVRQICAGLREAHAQGVVHRDLKPQNIMIDAAGKVTLMDFGIARSVESGHTLTVGVIGTPAYMAPEQAEGKPVDHRTDIYALGLVMYEIFTGSLAFSGETMVSVMMKQIMEAPRPPRELQPSLPPVLEAAILGCLAKNPDHRFASIADLEAVLGDLSSPTIKLPLPTLPVAVPVQAVPAPVAPPAARKWWKTGIGIAAMGCGLPVFLVCLTLVIIVIWGTKGRDKSRATPTSVESTTPAVAPATPPSAKPRGRKAKAAPESPQPPAPEITIPGVNAPIPGLPNGVVNVPEIVRQAKETQVKAWISRGDAAMQAKNYDAAIRVFEMAAAANQDDQEIKDKLAKAREAKAAAGKQP